MIKKILCYGDSNTFGYNPENGLRFDENTRWTGVLQNVLKGRYEIIEEGLNNRTGFVDSPDGFLHSAQSHFKKLIEKMEIIDIFVIALGTNDLQFCFDVKLSTIKNGLSEFILSAKKHNPNSEIIIIPPVVLNESVLFGTFSHQFNEKSIEKSKKILKPFEEITKAHNLELIDINKFSIPSNTDGLHYDKKSHTLIAKKLANCILKEKV